MGRERQWEGQRKERKVANGKSTVTKIQARIIIQTQRMGELRGHNMTNGMTRNK